MSRSEQPRCTASADASRLGRRGPALRRGATLALAALVTAMAAVAASGAVSVTGTLETTAQSNYQVVPAGERAFLLHGDGGPGGARNTITVLTTAGGSMRTVTDAATINIAEYGAVAGGRLYLANQDQISSSYAIGVLDAATGASVGTIALATSIPKWAAATPDGRTVAVFSDTAGSGDATVTVIAAGAATGTTVPITGVARSLYGYALSPDSRYAYAVADTIATVLRIDLSTRTLEPSIDVGFTTEQPTGVAVSPDGRRLAVTYGSAGVVVHDLSTGAESRITSGITGNANAAPVFSADGSRLFVATTAARVIMIDVAGAAVLRSIDVSAGGSVSCRDDANCLRLSVDGSQLLFPMDATATSSDPIGVIDTATLAFSTVPVGSRPVYVWTVPGSATAYATYGGISDDSPRVTVLRTADPPGAPTAVSATAGLLSAAVSWTAPTSDGGNAIVSYTATASPGGASCTATAPATTCTITGLLNTTAYSFSVTAANLAGTGAASAASAEVRPYRRLAMAKPRARGTRIASTVKTTGRATITQTIRTATGRTACSKRVTAKRKGSYAISCPLNSATRKALRKRAQTLTVTTTVLTSKGATLLATHAVRVPKTR